jgi:GNAT superfamily N-acetyltransferase
MQYRRSLTPHDEGHSNTGRPTEKRHSLSSRPDSDTGSSVMDTGTDEGDKPPNGEPGPGGEVVGWAQWDRMGTSLVARNWHKPGETWDKYYSYVDPVNNGKNFSDLMSILRKPFDPEVFAEAWELSGFYVRRKYQRRGLGKILLRWELAQAAAEKVPVIAKSSPAGIKSYEQAGFRDFEKIDFGGSFDTGGRGINVMVWKPPGMEGQ